MERRLNLIYWSATRLHFMRQLEERCQKCNIKYTQRQFSHHSSWYSDGFLRYPLNALSLSMQIVGILFNKRKGSLVLFGTNLCRIIFIFFYFKKDVFYIYNELPELDNRTTLKSLIDRLIFCKANNVFVSSRERKALCDKYFHLNDKIGIVNNLSISSEIGSNSVNHKKGNTIIYAGLISSSRFSESTMAKLESSQFPLVIYGNSYESDLLPSNSSWIQRHPAISHDKLLAKLRDFKYSLLAYDVHVTNNDYCAPIKIYEYIDAGCVVISVNRNKGLIRYFAEFPALFCWLDDLVAGKFKLEVEAYTEQRLNFLSSAVLENEPFYTSVLDST